MFQLSSTYVQREKVIKGCITYSANRIKLLADQKTKNPDDASILKDLRREQTKVPKIHVLICFKIEGQLISCSAVTAKNVAV